MRNLILTTVLSLLGCAVLVSHAKAAHDLIFANGFEVASSNQDLIFANGFEVMPSEFNYADVWGSWRAGQEQQGAFQYLWNAPLSSDWSTGAISDLSSFRQLHYVTGIDGAYSGFKVDSDTSSIDSDPAGHLSLRDQSLMHPGRNAGYSSSGRINGQDRYVIIAYTVQDLNPNVDEGGFFSIQDSYFQKLTAAGDELEILVFTSTAPNNPAIQTYADPPATSSTLDKQIAEISFNGFIGYVAEGQTIYIAIGANGSDTSDLSKFDFTIVRSAPIFVANAAAALQANRIGSNYDWKLQWNAPNGWTSSDSGDLSTGALEAGGYDDLLKLSGQSWYNASGQSSGNTTPAGALKFRYLAGNALAHPGFPAAHGGHDRYAISAYTVPQSGLYALHDAWFEKPSSSGSDGVKVRVFIDDQALFQAGEVVAGSGTGRKSFSMDLGYLAKGQTIYTAFGSMNNQDFDTINYDYSVVEYAPRAAPLRDMVVDHTIGVAATSDALLNRNNIRQAFIDAKAYQAQSGNQNAVVKIELDHNGTYLLDMANAERKFLFDLAVQKQILFDGRGSTLLLENPRSGLFVFRGSRTSISEQIIFRNFKIDYANLPFTQGQIIETEKLDSHSARVRFKTTSGYDSPMSPHFTPNHNRGFLYEAQGGIPTGRMIDGSWSDYIHDPDHNGGISIVPVSGATNTFDHYVQHNPGIDVLVDNGVGNTWVVRFRHSGMSNFKFVDSANMTIDNVVSYTSAGTFLQYFTADNVSVLNSALMIKPGSGRARSSSSDAVFGRGRQGLWIENSMFQSAGDDLFNAQGRTFIASAYSSTSKTIEVKIIQGGTPLSDSFFQVGDELGFFEVSTGTEIARRHVTGVSVVDATTLSLTIDETVVGFDTNNAANDTKMVLYNVELAANYMIRDNEYLNSFRFGLLLRAKNVMVLGNTFKGNLEHAIMSVNEPGWPEGYITEGLLVQGNSFDDNARGIMSQQRFFLGDDPADVVVGVFKTGNDFATDIAPISNVKILDNVFDNWRGMAISVRNSRDVTIENNTFNLSTDDTPMREKLDQDPLLEDTDTTGRYAAIYLIDNNGVRIKANTYDHRNSINADADDEDIDVVYDGSSQNIVDQ